MTENSTKPLDIKFQDRFTKNLIANIIYFGINIIIGLALVPFFLHSLGESAYGLVPLATSLTSYVTLVIDAINGAISRYLTLDLQKGDTAKANETFNTALFGTLGVILILVPVALFVACCAPLIFDIGNENPIDVILLFSLVFGSILIRTWSSNFQVPLFANNRLDLQNIVNATNLIAQIVIVVPLFLIFGATLPFVGLSYFLAAILALFTATMLSHKVSPFLKISLRSFSCKRAKEILGVSGWLTVTKLGLVLKNQLALMVVNISIGAVAGTEYSLAVTWSTLIMSIISLLVNCFTPQVYSYRAKNDSVGMTRFVSVTVKITTALTAILVGLVVVFAGQLMTFWVGSEYARLAPLVAFIVIPVIFSVQSSCCAPINASYVKVRVPAFANIFGGITTLILALFLPTFFGIYGVALAVGISTFLVSGFISPVYGAYLLKIPKYTFLKPAVPGYILLVILILSGEILNSVLEISSIFEVIVAGCILGIFALVFVIKLLLGKDERKMMRLLLPDKLNRIIPAWVL